ncbi:MAG: hypothetical protein M3071_08595 [Actinomycetota bacterium]|nr:hypothetical protein [Actinomycetota bacterium]
MPAQANGSPAQLIFDVFEFTVGLGVFVMALFPLAVPGIVIVLVPLLVIALAGAIVSAAVVLPLVLLQRITRRVRVTLLDRRVRPQLLTPATLSRSARKSSHVR